MMKKWPIILLSIVLVGLALWWFTQGDSDKSVIAPVAKTVTTDLLAGEMCKQPEGVCELHQASAAKPSGEQPPLLVLQSESHADKIILNLQSTANISSVIAGLTGANGVPSQPRKMQQEPSGIWRVEFTKPAELPTHLVLAITHSDGNYHARVASDFLRK